MMIIDNKYELGEIVFLKTDIEQNPRIVTAIIVSPENLFSYELSAGTSASKHYCFEITPEKTVFA